MHSNKELLFKNKRSHPTPSEFCSSVFKGLSLCARAAQQCLQQPAGPQCSSLGGGQDNGLTPGVVCALPTSIAAVLTWAEGGAEAPLVKCRTELGLQWGWETHAPA